MPRHCPAPEIVDSACERLPYPPLPRRSQKAADDADGLPDGFEGSQSNRLGSSYAEGDACSLPADRETLFTRFRPWLDRLMHRYRLSGMEREDALGEVYCRFCGLVEQYDAHRGIPLEPYLYRNLGAFLYTFARSGWRRHRRELPLFVDEGCFAESLCADPTPEWDDRLFTNQLSSVLPLAFRQIPARQQDVITLRYYQDLSYAEVAERLDIKPATARSLERHGLNSLRKWMHSRQLVCF